MTNSMIGPTLECAHYLAAMGCPLDSLDAIDKDYARRRRRLVLKQVGGVLENQLFGLGNGGARFIISLRIGFSARMKMPISGWELELPGMKSQINWPQDPGESGSNQYVCPGALREEYDRQLVLNHVRALRGPDLLDGFLLGSWFEPLHEIYSHGTSVNATLVLLDEIGRDYPTEVSLLVDRKSERSRPRSARPKRKSLFEVRDCVKAPASRR
jgi:hypothetical protein